jgi:tetratricopeptide (TPR) repeat protein
LKKGGILFELSQFEEAIQCFDIVLDSESDYLVWLSKAGALSKLERYEESLNCYKECIKANPNDQEVYQRMYNILSDSSRYEEACDCLQKIIQLDPNNEVAVGCMARVLRSLSRHEEAIEWCDKLVASDPQDMEAYVIKGESLVKMTQYVDALECFDASIEKNPLQSTAYFQKGQVLADHLCQYDLAIKCFDLAIQNCETEISLYYAVKGTALTMLTKFEEGIKCFDIAISLDPTSITAINVKAVALRRLGRFNEALVCHDQAILIIPKNGDLHYNKAGTLDACSRYEEALRCYNLALLFDPTLISTICIPKAICLIELDKKSESAEYINKIVKLFPEYHSAGGFGKVFFAPVSVYKVISSPTEYPLKREVSFLKGVQSTNIIPLINHYSFTTNDTHWYILRMTRATTTLSKMLKFLQFNKSMIPNLMIGLLNGLQYMHSKHVIHCDCKPSNIGIMLPLNHPDCIKILDFGAARLNGIEKLRAHTPRYTCPVSQIVNVVTDLFSIGVILQDCMIAVSAHNQSDESPISKIVAKACSVNLLDRYKSANEMLQDFLEKWNQVTENCSYKPVTILSAANNNNQLTPTVHSLVSTGDYVSEA